jgi:ABC-type amino acid transport substrate-binding protein
MIKRILSIVLTLSLTLVLTACSAKQEGNSDTQTSGSEPSSAAVTQAAGTDSSTAQDTSTTETIKVGTMGTYNPFSYEDENGNLTGYDLEVLRLLEKQDPSLKFEFVAAPWDSLFVGLDSDKFQMLANQITSNTDRVANITLHRTAISPAFPRLS